MMNRFSVLYLSESSSELIFRIGTDAYVNLPTVFTSQRIANKADKANKTDSEIDIDKPQTLMGTLNSIVHLNV